MGRAGFGRSVEGFHATAAAAEAGRVEVLYVERRRRNRSEVDALVDLVVSGGGEVRQVDDVRSRAETGAPQGLVAECRAIESQSLEAIVATAHPAAVMVLDRVVDPHNLGAIIRSCVAAGITGFVVSDRRAAPLGAATLKAAAGAVERASFSIVGSVAEALSRLSRLGLWVVGLDSAGDASLFGLDLLTEPVALVVGAEGRGLSRLVGERLDVVAAIPMAAETESLNASVAAALAAFEVLRARS